MDICKKSENSETQASIPEKHFRGMIESTAGIPWIVDFNSFQFTYVGPQAEKILGYPVGQWYKNDFWGEYIHPDDREATIKFCMEASQKKENFNFEYRMIHRDGHSVWILDYVNIVIENDMPVRLQGFMFDISGRKQAEAELKEHRNHLEDLVAQRTVELTTINQELEAFSYSISHDLRAPLRHIDGFSQILLEDYAEQLDAEGLSYLKRVRTGAQRMGQLIDDLLQLSRASRGELKREPLILSAMAQEIIDKLQHYDTDRSVTVSITPALIGNADHRLMHVALGNLIGNAWKYSSKTDNACIEFGAKNIDGETTYYLQDNGAGFDMANADKIFAPFKRLHSESEFEGTGIGLATVHSIISRHGGRIWVEAEKNKGATFYFTLGNGKEDK